MAFIRNAQQVFAFADYQDVIDQDARLFRENEGLSQEVVEQALVRATEKLVNRFSASAWWKNYYIRRDTTTFFRTSADIPALDPLRIVSRQQTFTDLCVYTALAIYILPGVADFSNQDNAERQKIDFYTQQADIIFKELIEASDWYDFNSDGQVTSEEREPGIFNPKRVR